MYCRNYSTGPQIFITWGFICLILSILFSSLPDFIIQVRAMASIFPNEAAVSLFHGFADGFSLVLIVISLFLNLEAVLEVARSRRDQIN